MLQIKGLHAKYGAIEALKGIDMTVEDGKICCVIGSNGAGKSTLLKSISGIIPVDGDIIWNNQNLTKLSSRKIAQLGIAHVPEGRHVFPGLSVSENLEVATVSWHGFWGKKSYQDELEMVYNLFPRLKEREKQMAWSLSGGEQQMLAMGRALMSRPKLLMLDEPSMGLAPVVVEEMFAAIVEINKRTGLPILLIEQNARIALNISDYAYVMEQGKINFHGEAAQLKNDPRILTAYLGKFAKMKH